MPDWQMVNNIADIIILFSSLIIPIHIFDIFLHYRRSYRHNMILIMFALAIMLSAISRIFQLFDIIDWAAIFKFAAAIISAVIVGYLPYITVQLKGMKSSMEYEMMVTEAKKNLEICTNVERNMRKLVDEHKLRIKDLESVVDTLTNRKESHEQRKLIVNVIMRMKKSERDTFNRLIAESAGREQARGRGEAGTSSGSDSTSTKGG